MIRWLLAAVIMGLSLPTAATDCGGPLQPFRAEYQVERNGKPVGVATASLQRSDGESWEYRMETNADRGIGGLLGGSVTESTQFTALDEILKPLRYRYRQKVALSKRERHIDFDWPGSSATGNEGKRAWTVSLQGAETDRLLSGLQISTDLRNGARGELLYRVMDDDGEAETKRFVTGSLEMVRSAGGAVQGLRVERIHDNDSRTTVGWYSPEQQFLPVRMERHKSGGDSIIMTLKSMRVLPCAN